MNTPPSTTPPANRFAAQPQLIRLALAAYLALTIYLMTYPGADHAHSLWILSFPPVAILLRPGREGGAWSLGSLAVTVILMLSGRLPAEGAPYPYPFMAAHLGTFCLIAGGLAYACRRHAKDWQERGRLSAELSAVREQLEQEILQREAREEEILYLETTDPLTGLLNRRAFMTELQDELARVQRKQGRHTLIMLDIDHFKAINDQHGQPAGDAVLADLAKRLTDQLRTVDRLGRVGGQEFAVLLVDTAADAAAGVVNRLQEAIRNTPASLASHEAPIAFTVSMGCTESRPDDDELTIMARSDRALYAAKQGGRDCHVWG